MSKASSTAVCESRKLAHLTLSKGGRMARVTPTSRVVDCFRLNLKFCPKRFWFLIDSKEKCYPHYRKMRLCFCTERLYEASWNSQGEVRVS